MSAAGPLGSTPTMTTPLTPSGMSRLSRVLSFSGARRRPSCCCSPRPGAADLPAAARARLAGGVALLTLIGAGERDRGVERGQLTVAPHLHGLAGAGAGARDR